MQTELDDTKAYYQLIIRIAISEKKKNSEVMKKGENSHYNTDRGGVNISKVKGKNTKATARAGKRNYNFECDWLI